MNLLDRIASFFATDVVGIWNASEEQVFADAIPMKAAVNRYSKQFEHPLESSVVITDHRVIMPDEVQLAMIVPKGRYKDVYKQVSSAFQSGDILEVRTKAATYTNMVIQAMPHEESPEKFDAIDLIINLKETQFESVNIQAIKLEKAKDETQSDTTERGQQNEQSQGSVASQIVDGVKELFERWFK